MGFGTIYYFSGWIFSVVLGSNWAIVGQYTKILIPMFFFNFISMSMGGILIIAERLRVSLVWQITNLVMTLIALIIGSLVLESVLATLWAITIAKSASYIMHMVLSYYFSGPNQNVRLTKIK
jgi:O-antigen/teichoic acid export membrane protein